MQDTRTDNTLVDLITCMRKHILGMLIVFVCIVVVAIIYIINQTPIYEVGSSILVKYGREYVYRSTGELADDGDVPPMNTYNSATVISTELEIIKSADLAEEVISSVGVEKLFPNLASNAQDKEEILPFAIGSFAAKLNVSHIKGSNVLSVAFQHEDPHVAVQAVNNLIERFKDKHLQIFKNPQTTILKEQVDLYHEKLVASEDALKKFKQENHIYTKELNDKQELYLNHYSQLKHLLITDIVKSEGLEEMQASLESQLEEIPEITQNFTDTTRGSDESSIGYKLLDLKMQETRLLNKYKGDNREIDEIREQIELAEEFIANQEVLWRESTRKGENTVYDDVNKRIIFHVANAIGQEKRNSILRQYVDESKAQLEAMIPLEADLNRLNREVETAERAYSLFHSKFEESRIQDTMDSQKIVNLVVIEKPRVPLRPVKPRKKIALLVGIILATASSFFYALFVEYAMARKV